MARGYYTSKISENLEETPEGYLIARNVPIARTGPQDYKVSDLPQDTARELGLDTSNPGASITIYRPPEEVFHPDTLKSFEGKPLTKTHPQEFVDPHTYREVAMGHVQNVRKGSQQLEGDDEGAGEWPVIADIIVTAEPLLSLVKNGSMRELSCGYDFGIKRNEDNPRLIDQCAIVGNHVAVVPHGRAGSSVRIIDAMPEFIEPTQVSEPPALVASAPTYPPVAINFPTNKETHVSVKHKMLRLLMGKQLIEMARATDADPEKILDAAEELTKPDEPVEDKGKDKAKDTDPDKGDLIGTTPNAVNDKGKAKDAGPNTFESGATDRRKGLHDALDEMLNKRDEKQAADKKGKDSDIAELKDLLDQFLSEEQKEPEHAADKDEPADPSELDSLLGGEDAEEECSECGEKDCVCDSETEPGEETGASGEENIEDADPAINAPPEHDHGPGDKKGKDKDKGKAKDAAVLAPVGSRARANDAVAAALRTLRPSIAKCNDKAVHDAFNSVLGSVTRASKPSTGSYGAFAGAARARDNAPRNPDRSRANDSAAQDQINKLKAYYADAAPKGGK